VNSRPFQTKTVNIAVTYVVYPVAIDMN